MSVITVEKTDVVLDMDNELKMFSGIDTLACRTSLDVVATFLGAYTMPEIFIAGALM